MRHYAAKRDANEREIVSALQANGVLVKQISQPGVPDLLCGYDGKLWLLEVKDPKQPASAQALKPLQSIFFKEWHGYPVRVVLTPQDALMAVGAI